MKGQASGSGKYKRFSMYMIIYGLHNIGLTAMLIQYLQPLVSDNLVHASVIMGLDPLSLKISYLASP
nr:arsenic efflux pump protein [Paenibacillus elgii]